MYRINELAKTGKNIFLIKDLALISQGFDFSKEVIKERTKTDWQTVF